MKRSEKIEAVNAIEQVYRNNNAVIVTHYHGLTVSQVSKLRKNLKESGASFKVIKNTLAKIAANNVGLKEVDSLFKGPVGVAFSTDSVSIAKAVHKFAKENEAFKVVGGILDNNVVDSAIIKQLSTLPSLNELRGTIVGIIQAPATKVAAILAAPAGQLARVISAYAKK